MRKSQARRALEAALAEAPTGESRADIAAKLSNVIDAEGRERARKRRARTKRLKEAPAPPPRQDDSDEPFDFEPAPPTPPTPKPQMTAAQLREHRASLRKLGCNLPHDEALDGPKPKPRDYAAEIAAALEARPRCAASGLPNGFTRKMDGMEANEYRDAYGNHFVWDAAMGCFRRNYPEQVYAVEIVPANDVMENDTWTNADGWASEAKKQAEEERDAIWQEYLDKVAGR